MKIKWNSQEPVPTGEYTVVVDAIEEEEGRFGPQLVWRLRVVTPPYEGRDLVAWTSINPSIKSKLARWAAALGFPPKPGEELDIQRLYGRKARAIVIVRQYEDGGYFSKVEDLQPIRKALLEPSDPEYDPFDE